ncbi:FAD-binding oxidoreductase [Planomonospora sp. ID67723]|uniref:FAD-binding oxidoreductase n=1 Tax=Planomonospora sp. ID67723 TaxID=2738134 RepID=UPI0018C37A41|nr:FAD-binding oxidoreductase [Planomonospora sp. ID67723]MBG0830142.1 FAD-binding oxidoreductase [Planomonospora sp. ID67723]
MTGPRMIHPDEPGYQARRKAFLGTLAEELPVAVACCASEADVVSALELARARGLPFALRGGGHSFAEHSSTTGLLVDLGAMKTIEVGAESVRVGPGVQIGELARRLAEHGRMVPCGWCPTVGVAGAVLGGGYGPFSRLYGLGADHLLAARAVLADGRSVEAGDDLLWALRGAGGGNFGVVTQLTLRTRPIVPITAVQAVCDFGRAADLVDAWQHWAPEAPDEVNLEIAVVSGDEPGEPPYAVLFGIVAGPEEWAGKLVGDLAPLDRLRLTRLEGAAAACHHAYADGGEGAVTALPYGERPGLRLNKSGFFDGYLPRVVIEDLLGRLVADRVRGEIRDLEFVPWAGAIARVAPDASAFVHRTPRFLLKQAVQVGFRATDSRRRDAHAWLCGAWARLSPWASGAVYPNYPDADLEDWAQAYYGSNLPRLREVKAAYDPAGLFRFAQSLR